MRLMIKAGLMATGLALVLSGCSEDEQADIAPPTPGQIAFAEQARPADPGLADIYDRSCASCHALVDAGAPLTGHGAAWDARIADRGRAGLLASIKNGMNAMPAMGLCADCSDEEFLALIDFMAIDGEMGE